MRRTILITFTALIPACTIAPSEGMGGFGSPGVGSADTGGETGEASTGAAEASTGADGESQGDTSGDPSTTGLTAGSTSAGDESTSGLTAGSTGVPGDTGDTGAGTTGGLEEGGPYAPCETTADCGDPSLACLTSDQNGANGFCSATCGSGEPTNPALCPDAPQGVTATVTCIAGFFANSCALDCSSGTCPEGTECLMANNGYGPYCYGS